MDKLKIEYIKIDEIKPYENNARKHETKDVEAIKKSIENFGMNDPIGIWSEDNIIVEGHGRLMACKKLGYTEVPCIRLDQLTDDQRKAYALAHNKTAELSVWDFDKLEEELAELGELDLDFSMTDFGFDLSEFEEKEEKERKDMSDTIKDSYEIIIECKDEEDLEIIYNECIERGYKCRISTL